MGITKSKPLKRLRFSKKASSKSESFSNDDVINQLMIAMDENEVDRLQIQHHLFRELWGENFNSPIKNELKAGGFHVLDVGCGPGTWVCDMATDFPSSEFKGIDIVPMFPTQKPTNIKFEEANILTGLPYSDNSFDFVHMSSMILVFTEAEWRTQVLSELSRVLKPGGYLELEDGDIESCNKSPSFDRLSGALRSRFVSRNMNPLIAKHFGEIMESTGSLINIEHREINIPIGGWGGNLGELMGEIVIRLFEGLRDRLILNMNIRPKEFDKIIESFRYEMDLYRLCASHNRVFAMKKCDDSSSV